MLTPSANVVQSCTWLATWLSTPANCRRPSSFASAEDLPPASLDRVLEHVDGLGSVAVQKSFNERVQPDPGLAARDVYEGVLIFGPVDKGNSDMPVIVMVPNHGGQDSIIEMIWH
jgi:hypothetical protein